MTDDFEQAVKRQILAAYGFESEGELDAAIEEALPGYLDAEAERKARHEAYLAALPGRMQETAETVTAQLRTRGLLPDGVGFAVVTEEPIVVGYATDRPVSPLLANERELIEEQKQAMAEAATAQIEQWRQQWGTAFRGGPSDEFLAGLADPIRLEPKATPWRDKPRTRDYPSGG